MKLPFDARAPAFDAAAIQDTIERALASAGLDTSKGPLLGVTDTIRRALATAPAADAAARAAFSQQPGSVPMPMPMPMPVTYPIPEPAPESVDVRQPSGRFVTHEFRNAAGRRAYKSYVPATPAEAPRPIVVMLHGCTQSADDFAAGTQMNRLADEHGLIVVYPEQAADANASKCWNWFQPQDQRRGSGEPSLIAGIVGEVAARHGADPRRIFVAGLSAGAAMAVVLGETYPELFAAVGVHSGLPFGSAHDIPSALAAMKGGRSGLPGLKTAAVATTASTPRRAVQPVPVIVFHGDRDHTVQPSNGAHIVRQALDAHAGQVGEGGLQMQTHDAVAPGGRRYRRSVHTDADGQVRVESWTLHGAGHA
jgi:poly(hydroxyalkanoate) depolymerase family esterase